MRARFAFPMQSTGRGIAAAPESVRRTAVPPARPRTREGPRARRRLPWRDAAADTAGVPARLAPPD